MRKFFNALVIAVMAITSCQVLTSCGKSQEWYDKNQNFGDIEGTWVCEKTVQGMPQTITVTITEDGKGTMKATIGGRTIINDDVKLGRSKENLSILFSNLSQATLHIKDGEVYSAEWEPFDKQ